MFEIFFVCFVLFFFIIIIIFCFDFVFPTGAFFKKKKTLIIIN